MRAMSKVTFKGEKDLKKKRTSAFIDMREIIKARDKNSIEPVRLKITG
jgi:hypothetical protein